jgi:hypothetical protein
MEPREAVVVAVAIAMAVAVAGMSRNRCGRADAGLPVPTIPHSPLDASWCVFTLRERHDP